MSSNTVPVTNSGYKADRADIVIVGNGIAGLTAAVEARRLAPDSSIVIITDQSHPTINTPALKQFAIGKLTQEQLLAYPPGIERAQRIDVISTRVEEINAQGKFVSFQRGNGFGFGSLVIATGSVPTALPTNMPGRNFDGVMTLHCLQDYMNFRRRLPEVEEVVVIGGGTHAIETVMGLVHLRMQVHWLIRGKTFLSKTLDEHASEMVLEHVRQAGVKVYTDTQVTGIVGRVGSVVGVVTNYNQMIPCELVLACTGTTPITTLAKCCSEPMMHQNGILVDDQLRTNVRDIYAAGAVAALKNPQTGTYETRPLWYAAALQGRSVAAMMTGHHELAEQPFGVPWHATQLGNLCMLSVGSVHDGSGGVTSETNGNRRSYRRLSMINDRLVGYLSLGPNQPDSLAIKRIIDEGLSIRDVKKSLLDSNFDARTHFSRQQSYAVRDMVTSGKIPAINWIQHTVHKARVMYIPAVMGTHLLQQRYGRRNTEELPAAEAVEAVDQLAEPRQTAPLSNALPIPAQQAQFAEEEEEIHPVTGNLIQLPSRPMPRSLWSYSDKVPVVEAEPVSLQNMQPHNESKGQFVTRGGQ